MERNTSNDPGEAERRCSPQSLRNMLTIVDSSKSGCNTSEVAQSTSGLLARLEAFLPKLAEANSQLATPCKPRKPDIVEEVAFTTAKSQKPLLTERRTMRLSAASTHPLSSHSERNGDGISCESATVAAHIPGKCLQRQRRVGTNEHELIASLDTKADPAVGLTESPGPAKTGETLNHTVPTSPSEALVVRHDRLSNSGDSDHPASDDDTHVVEMHLFVDDSFGELVASDDAPDARPLIRELHTRNATTVNSHTNH